MKTPASGFDLFHELRQPAVVRPDQVRGVLGHKEAAAPTRRFYILDTRGRTDYVWEVDAYQKGTRNAPLWLLHLICPTCDRLLSIRGDRKAIEVGERYLEVEPFGCTWPGDFGQVQCTFRAGIVKPRERIIATDQGPREIHGAFKRA